MATSKAELLALLREADETLVGEWAIRMAHASREGLPEAIAQAEIDAAEPLRALARRIHVVAEELKNANSTLGI